jgi:hypothetical protein
MTTTSLWHIESRLKDLIACVSRRLSYMEEYLQRKGYAKPWGTFLTEGAPTGTVLFFFFFLFFHLLNHPQCVIYIHIAGDKKAFFIQIKESVVMG